MKASDTNQFWFNLPVTDIERARKFYNAIGFVENERHEGNKNMASFYMDKNKTVLMLFPKGHFESFLGNSVTDTAKSNEVFLNIDAPSRAAIDDFAKVVEKAGAHVFAKPNEVDGWMYLMGFTDPDGHRWGVLYMDESNIPTE